MSYHLKPKKGLRVLKPGTKTPLDKDGEIVDESSYWKRRIAAEEVEFVEEKKEEPKEEKKEFKKEQSNKNLGGEK
jgi:hypothetical protein